MPLCNNRRPPPQPRPKEKDPAAATSARQSPQRSHEAPRSHTKTKQAGRNLLDPRRLFAPQAPFVATAQAIAERDEGAEQPTAQDLLQDAVDNLQISLLRLAYDPVLHKRVLDTIAAWAATTAVSSQAGLQRNEQALEAMQYRRYCPPRSSLFLPNSL